MASTQSQPSVFVREGFRWDAHHAYLFDIDGTLLRCRDRIHVNAFLSSVRAVMGRDFTLDGVTLSGNTDPGILRDVFRLAALESAHWEPHFEAILQRMRDDVALRRDEMKIDKMPGVDEALQHLRAKGAVLGIATGNLETIGWLKIEHLGLRHWFTFGGFSDRFPARADMIADAARKARTQAGLHASVCVVGDTPSDITAARANKLAAIAVATGNYTFDQLMEHDPDACAANFIALRALTENS
ncbi:MAG TPA: HAD family hydrolase [Acidobacteriaceae bacterium]|nr:HAD family hydrolase [Acidobacteriaceae bacterium]